MRLALLLLTTALTSSILTWLFLHQREVDSVSKQTAPIQCENKTSPVLANTEPHIHPSVQSQTETPDVITKKEHRGNSVYTELTAIFNSESHDIFSTQEFEELSYLIKNDDALAARIMNMLSDGNYESNKHALIHLLAKNKSDETVRYAEKLISENSLESRQKGFELLTELNLENHDLALTETLLESCREESEPALLADAIYHLSNSSLDDADRKRAQDEMDILLQNGNNYVKARAIDGIARLGNQAYIYDMVNQYLDAEDEDIRYSAISAVSSLDKSVIARDFKNYLTDISKNPDEPETLRTIADNVIESLSE